MAEHFGQAARKLLEREGIELVVSDAAWGARHELHDGLVEIGEDDT
jgi:galactitol-specific phosphotransferase system IIC component